MDILLSNSFDPFSCGLALQHALLDVEGEEGREDVVADYCEGQVGGIFEFESLEQSWGVVYHCSLYFVKCEGY